MKVYTNLMSIRNHPGLYSSNCGIYQGLWIICGADIGSYEDKIVLFVMDNKVVFDNVSRHLDIYVYHDSPDVLDFDIGPYFMTVSAIPNKFKQIEWHDLENLGNKYNGIFRNFNGRLIKSDRQRLNNYLAVY